MTPSPEGLVGREFGGYRLLRVLGSGAMGTVYLAAKVDSPEQQVAIKVLLPPSQASAADRAEFKARFAREAKALQLLEHPHILSLLDFGEDAETGLSYMVLPYMSGGTLAGRVAQGALPLPDVARYASQVADALDYAHGRGIVHRDIKPGNILLNEADDVFLADFGIAKIFDTAGTTLMTLTNTGQVMGTIDYMSPEQAEGEEVGPASDIYSLGMVLYHLVTGTVPFGAKSVPQLMRQITDVPPTPPRQRRAELPAPAEAAVLRALAKQPIDRFQTAGELASAFTQGLQNEWAPGLRQAATLDAFVPQQTIAAPRDDRRVGAALTRPPVLIAGVSALLIVAVTSTLLLSGFLTHSLVGQSKSGNTGTVTATTANTATTGSPTLTVTTAPNATATSTSVPSGGNGGPTPPTPRATFTPTATPTPFSYSATAPGPGCDSGGASWSFRDSNGSSHASCLSGPTRLHMTGFNCSFCQGTISENDIEWDASTFPTTLTVTVTISNLNYAQVSGAEANIGIGSGLSPSDYQYYLQDQGNGIYWVMWCHNGCYILHTGNVSPADPVTLTVNFGPTLNWYVNGQEVYSESGAGITPPPKRIFMQVLDAKVNVSPAADFSNFKAT
jgi:serine/threonine protein kinase